MALPTLSQDMYQLVRDSGSGDDEFETVIEVLDEDPPLQEDLRTVEWEDYLREWSRTALGRAFASNRRKTNICTAQIKLLPIVTMTQEMLETECSICLVKFESDEKNVRKIPCDHVFHEPCITQWLIHSDTCPLCRTSVVLPPPVPDERARRQIPDDIFDDYVSFMESYHHVNSLIQRVRLIRAIMNALST